MIRSKPALPMRLTILTTIALAAVVLVACNGASQGDGATKGDGTTQIVPDAKIKGEIFGDGTHDPTLVIAEVDGYKITERMLDTRFTELPKEEKRRFEGEEGKRFLLRQMVDDAIKLREAEKRKLERVPDVARVLISQRRIALGTALTNQLIENKEPSVEQIRAFYEANKDRYVRLGTIHAAHIECATEAEARRAYDEARKPDAPFARVVAKYSQDDDTKASGGDLGWFNKGGFVPGVLDTKQFTEACWPLEKGLNPPLEIGGKWHVINIYERQYDRPQTLEEAYENVVRDFKPDFHASIIEDWADQARAAASITYFGDYRPGKGRTARELLNRAMGLNDTQQKLDLYGLIVQDYPDDELADDALFLAANEVLDAWGDRGQAGKMLTLLIRKYPQSEYLEDAKYLKENMVRPDFVKPKSIEDLRPKP